MISQLGASHGAPGSAGTRTGSEQKSVDAQHRPEPWGERACGSARCGRGHRAGRCKRAELRGFGSSWARISVKKPAGPG